MKIYLASRYTRRPEMEKHADLLQKAGYEITSTWVFGAENNLSMSQIARLDLNDVARADAVISFTEPFGSLTPRGGRHVEFGYGLALGLRMIIIGERENVFHYEDSIEVFPDLETWIKHDQSDS